MTSNMIIADRAFISINGEKIMDIDNLSLSKGSSGYIVDFIRFPDYSQARVQIKFRSFKNNIISYIRLLYPNIPLGRKKRAQKKRAKKILKALDALSYSV